MVLPLLLGTIANPSLWMIFESRRFEELDYPIEK